MNEGGNSDRDKLTYWIPLGEQARIGLNGYEESLWAKEVYDKLNIDIEFQHPPSKSVNEMFDIMMAMDTLPDIIQYNGWATGYIGGPGKAIDDGKIIDLMDIIEEKAPDTYRYFVENEDVMKMSKTDKGQLFGFPFVYSEKDLQAWRGIVIRNDWLGDLNMAIPKTMDEWETVLAAFSNQKGAVAPLSLSTLDLPYFCGAYNVGYDYYLQDGRVKLGVLEEGFKEFLTTMNRWYETGLLNKDISTLNSKMRDVNILGGISGAVTGNLGGSIGRWQDTATDDKFELAGVPYPVLQKGDRSNFAVLSPKCAGFNVVTTSCKNVDVAMKFLNYGFTEEGSMLYNFGVEGESYNMTDGYPTYTDVITNNPEGVSMSTIMYKYMRSQNMGPFVQDRRYMEQYAALPQQKQAWKLWADTDGISHMLPPFLYINEENLSDITKKTNTVMTYKEDMVLKFIMGVEPLSNYNEFIDGLYQRGIMDVLDDKQEAYERYLNR